MTDDGSVTARSRVAAELNESLHPANVVEDRSGHPVPANSDKPLLLSDNSEKVIHLPATAKLELLDSIERKCLFSILYLQQQDHSGFGLTSIRLRNVEQVLRANTTSNDLSEIFAQSNYHTKMILDGLIERGFIKTISGMSGMEPMLEITAKGKESLQWGAEFDRTHTGLMALKAQTFGIYS